MGPNRPLTDTYQACWQPADIGRFSYVVIVVVHCHAYFLLARTFASQLGKYRTIFSLPKNLVVIEITSLLFGKYVPYHL